MRSYTAAKGVSVSVPRHTMSASSHKAVFSVELLDDSRTSRVLQICTWQMFETCVSLVSNSASPLNKRIGLSADASISLSQCLQDEGAQSL